MIKCSEVCSEPHGLSNEVVVNKGSSIIANGCNTPPNNFPPKGVLVNKAQNKLAKVIEGPTLVITGGLSKKGIHVNIENFSEIANGNCASFGNLHDRSSEGIGVNLHEPETHYSYITKLTPHELVQKSIEVIKSGKHNSDVDGMHVLVNRHWNITLFEQLLSQYPDKIIIQYLKYGWPVNRDKEARDPTISMINHKGALNYSSYIDAYIQKEMKLGRMAGPYKNLPYLGTTSRIGVSPLNSVPKREVDERRVIIDFSWPLDNSVNSAIDKDNYMGTPIVLTYPTVDTLAVRVMELGVGCALFKKDLTSAFRQLMCDLYDYSLMIYQWSGDYYIDLAVAMGLVSAPSCCQRLTDAIVYIHSVRGYWLMNYIDDFIGAEKWSTVWESYHGLGNLLKSLGAKEAPTKSSEPDTQVNCLGTLFNTLSLTISVLPDRMVELLNLLNTWRWKKECSRRELEQLIGKLQFVSNCVRQSRVLISRMLNALRDFSRKEVKQVDSELRRDVRWWYIFLPRFNGTCIMWHLEIPIENTLLATDSSLHGGGGITSDEYFRIRYPAWLLNNVRYNIAHLEMYAIIVALKLWSHKFTGCKFIILCDNQACVNLINKGRARDRILQDCMREVVYLASMHDYWIRAEYIESKSNELPDLLSRWTFNRSARRNFRQKNSIHKLNRRFASLSLLTFQHDW